MTELSKKDIEILNLQAARMSTASIAMMVGLSEAKVYNRLTALQVFSAGDALDRLAGRSKFSLAGMAAFGLAEFGLLLRAMASAIEDAQRAAPTPPAARVVAVETPKAEPRPAPPRSATRRPRAAVAPSKLTPSTVADVSPRRARVVPRSSPQPPVPRGGLRLKSVSPRIATWAGHFRRARWPLAEVAHLFDVAEDDLAMALGEAA